MFLARFGYFNPPPPPPLTTLNKNRYEGLLFKHLLLTLLCLRHDMLNQHNFIANRERCSFIFLFILFLFFVHFMFFCCKAIL